MSLGPKTIFAPSNQAFRELMMENRPLTNNTETMSKLLRRNFVVNRRILPNEIINEMVVDTVSGEKLRFNIYNTVWIFSTFCFFSVIETLMCVSNKTNIS